MVTETHDKDMAKKTKNPTNLMSYDFLPNVSGGGNTMNNLFNQLMNLGVAQRQEPIAKQEAAQAFFKPISAYLDEANEKIVDGMVEYREENPELEEGMLFQGTDAAIGEALEANSVEFKKLNRKLAYMSPSSPNYAKTVAKMNKINKDNISLRDQNKKLLDIHNLLLTDRVQDISGANEAGMAKMFVDIQQNKTDNFSVKDGQIIWTNPDKNGLQREIKISGVKADGPILKTDVSNVFDLKTKFQKTPASLLDPSDAASKVGTQIKSLGKDGFSSMVWDNLNGNNAKYSKDNKFYNTQRLINDFEKTLGVTLSADEENRLKKEGPNYKFQEGGMTFGDYADKWVADEMLKEKKAGTGLPTKPTNDLDGTGLPFSNNQVFSGGVTGGNLNLIYSKLGGNAGPINVPGKGDYMVDATTNIWTNQKNGETMSGDQMIDVVQQAVPSFNLRNDVRFQQFKGTDGATQTMSLEGGDIKNKYGFGFSSQSISPNAILSTLQGMPSVGNINTEEDVQRVLDLIKSNPKAKERLIEQINSDNNTKIKSKHLEDMLEALINRIQ